MPASSHSWGEWARSCVQGTWPSAWHFVNSHSMLTNPHSETGFEDWECRLCQKHQGPAQLGRCGGHALNVGGVPEFLPMVCASVCAGLRAVVGLLSFVLTSITYF